MAGQLTCLIGLARSGKSTYSSRFDFQPKTVVVNSDYVRLAMHGERYNKDAEPFIRATSIVMVKSFLLQNYLVIIDESNTTIGSIRQWLEIDTNTKFIYIGASVETCKQRARDTNQLDLISYGVIDRMYSNLLDLCNYTIDKKIKIGELSADLRIDKVNEDDIMMSIEDIRDKVRRVA